MGAGKILKWAPTCLAERNFLFNPCTSVKSFYNNLHIINSKFFISDLLNQGGAIGKNFSAVFTENRGRRYHMGAGYWKYR